MIVVSTQGTDKVARRQGAETVAASRETTDSCSRLAVREDV